MRVVTWNVENLFSPAAPGTDPEGRPGAEAYEAKLRTLTGVVVAVDPADRWGFYRHGALLVGGAGTPAGCIAWTRA